MNAVLYPFTYKNAYIFDNQPLLDCININRLLSPSGNGIENLDAGEIIGCPYDLGIKVTSDMEEALDSCDILLLSEGLNLQTNYQEIIFKAHKLNKKIISMPDLEHISNLNTFYHSHYAHVNFKDNDLNTFNKYNSGLLNKLYKINTPIISLLGNSDPTVNFDIELKLRQFCLQKKYNIIQLGSHCNSPAFGFEYIRNILEQSSGFSNKVLYFNHYLYYAEQKYSPDLFIIGYPTSVFGEMQEDIQNDFGELSRVIACAVQPDISILNLRYFHGINSNYINTFCNLCNYKFNCYGDYVHLNNTIIVPSESEEIESEILYINYADIRLPISNQRTIMTKYNGFSTALEELFEQLENNIQTI